MKRTLISSINFIRLNISKISVFSSLKFTGKLFFMSLIAIIDNELIFELHILCKNGPPSIASQQTILVKIIHNSS